MALALETAPDQFPTRAIYPLGARVCLSAHGRDYYPRLARAGACGTVVGYGRGPRQIRIRRDGQPQAQTWHLIYWDPLGTEEA